ncbi:MAG: SDR family NAD(P)-dependent oxidoreductase [Halanaeroarchaeum sp.]
MVETVVVTGADDALGAAIVRAFATEDRHLVLGGSDADALARLAEDLADDGATTTAQRANARDEFDLERLMETASRAGEGIDVVIPAAAVSHDAGEATPLSETSYSAYDDTMRASARGVFAAITEALPHATADARVVVPVAGIDDPGQAGIAAVADAARVAIARSFADTVSVPVGAVAVGDLTPDAGDDADEAADLIRWAVDVDPASLDGRVLTAADRD